MPQKSMNNSWYNQKHSSYQKKQYDGKYKYFIFFKECLEYMNGLFLLCAHNKTVSTTQSLQTVHFGNPSLVLLLKTVHVYIVLGLPLGFTCYRHMDFHNVGLHHSTEKELSV
jgi:hypothetical protein